jgi:hypothetical protein
MHGDDDESGEPERGVRLTDGDGHTRSAVGRRLGAGPPDWFQTLGRGAWLLVGIAVLAAIVFFLLGLISDLLIPHVFAAILAAIFVPLVDLLERWRRSASRWPCSRGPVGGLLRRSIPVCGRGRCYGDGLKSL